MKSKLICRFALNTSFIIDNRYEFTKKTVDPDATQKDPRFSDDFKIECYFKDYCPKCNPGLPIDQLCKRCKIEMSSELPCWDRIRRILDNHPKRTQEDGAMMNFHNKDVDFQKYRDIVTNKKTDINCEEMHYFQEEPEEDDMSENEESDYEPKSRKPPRGGAGEIKDVKLGAQ